MGKFVIEHPTTERWYFNLKADNGQTILTSEQYNSKAACQKGIESVKTNATNDARYDRKAATNGQYYFILNAVNGEPIGTSEMYDSTYARDKGIEAVKINAPTAPVTEE